jgi:hypothetical protein
MAARTFGEFCAERGTPHQQRSLFRPWWHAAFRAGLELGLRLAAPDDEGDADGD